MTLGFEILPLKNEHILSYTKFNFNPDHRDPFDRMLVATSFFEKLPFITKDQAFDAYVDRVKIIW